MTEIRAKCKDYLASILSQQKIAVTPSTKKSKVKVAIQSTEIPEEIILHQKAQKLSSERQQPYDEIYLHLVLELASMIEAGIQNPFQHIINEEIGWNSPLFHQHADKERRDIINITKPVEVTEGFYQCPACKGKKTHHYSRQMRSADDPMTTVITCANTDCQYRWRIN